MTDFCRVIASHRCQQPIRQLRHLSSQSDASVKRHCLTPGGAGQYKSCAPGLRNTQIQVQKGIFAFRLTGISRAAESEAIVAGSVNRRTFTKAVLAGLGATVMPQAGASAA